MNILKVLIPLLCAGSAHCAVASEVADTVTAPFHADYEIEAAATVSSTGTHTPFWLISNRSGLGSPRTNTGFVRGAIHAGGTIAPRWSWSGGVDLVGSWRSESPFLVRELYGAARYRDFELTVGSRLEDDRLVDMKLSSGDLLFSGNALPIPQIHLSMPDYLNIPWLNNWLGFKAYFSLGTFTDGKWQRDFVATGALYYKDVRYHSKGLRIRIGQADRSPVTFEGGLEMAAQFGGKIMIGDSVVKKMPSSLKDVISHVIIPTGGGSSDLPGEQSNVLGNHVGEWSARLNWSAPADFKVSAYYLHFFEDHSMMFFDYVWHDGLWGLEVTLPANPFVNKFVYEYLGFKDQSGPVYWDHTPSIPEQVSGTDNYYNHYLYGGWQNRGMGIGNPLVLSPLWNANRTIGFQCNRILSHHFGLSGSPTGEIDWRILASYTRGWGTYGSPYRDVLRNFNLLAEISYAPRRLSGWSATIAGAMDRGGMIGQSNGLMLSIKKTGIL